MPDWVTTVEVDLGEYEGLDNVRKMMVHREMAEELATRVQEILNPGRAALAALASPPPETPPPDDGNPPWPDDVPDDA